jgi:hypothetical protein
VLYPPNTVSGRRKTEDAPHSQAKWLALVVCFIDCLASREGRWAEYVSSLLVIVAVATAIAKPTHVEPREDRSLGAASLLALIPCVAFSLFVLMKSWWRETESSDSLFLQSTIVTGCAFAPLAIMAVGFVAGISRRFAGRATDAARWLPRLQGIARALWPLAFALVIAGAARRATGVSPDAMRAIAYRPIPALSGSPPEAVIQQIDNDRALIVQRTTADGWLDLLLRDRRASSTQWIGRDVFVESEVQYDPRIGCMRIVAFRSHSATRCADDVTRHASAWTQRRSLAPTLGWVAMAAISLGFLWFAQNQRAYKQWRRATVNTDNSVSIDGERLQAARGVTIPHDTHELWVLIEAPPRASAPYRTQTERWVRDVSKDPFEREWRVVCWAVASALLFLTPLAFALTVGMITGR